jgi:hypothetical protein
MGNFSIEDLTSKLCETYEVSPEEAKKDVTEIVAQWQNVDVIE